MTLTYKKIFASEAEKRIQTYETIPVVSVRDLESLPAPIRKYLLFSGSIGKPRIFNFRVQFRGQMKKHSKGRALKIKAYQYSFFDEPARLYYIRSVLPRIPKDGLHLYANARALMAINMINRIRVADSRGPEMDQGETVTFFSDLCLLAPAALIDQPVVWEAEDGKTVHATYTNDDQKIQATLFFDHDGALVNFLSHDRYKSADGISYHMFPWSTTVADYREIKGRMVPRLMDASWHAPEGEFTYSRREVTEIQYNCTRFVM